MKKIFKGLICAGLCGMLAIGATGCNGSEHRNPETDALKLAIGSVDQKFNPLFYTSANDGTIANMTQVSMLSTNAEGKLAYGEDYPTVTLDYLETYKNGSEVLGTYDGKADNIPQKLNGATTTEYEFLIKNGMKFSDGEHDLTVMDVLFNLYVYLDPVYNGSNTIYSTKISGLQKYRQQNPNLSDDDSSNIDMSEYYGEAMNRISNLLYWSTNGGDIKDEEKQLQDDFDTVVDLYEEELNSTWNSIQTGWREAYKEDEYRFTEAWEAFYYQVGVITNQQVPGDYGYVDRKDESGRYYTSLDPDVNGDVASQKLIDETKAAYSEDKVKAYMSANGVGEEDAKLALQKKFAVDHVYNARATRSGISYILGATATYGNALDKFTLDSLSNANAGKDMRVQNISGITVSNTKFTNHQFNGTTYSEDHDILKITINGVDPKAKWNFGYTVAPMYYYSDNEHYTAAMKDYTDGKVYNGTANNFGVKFSDIKWFNSVLSGDAKTGVPVGAGAYKCSNSSYSDSTPTYTSFFHNYTAYFVRNEQFTTMGKGVENAKIRNVNYKVTRDDKIVESLLTKSIDYGEPNATSSNQQRLKGKGLEQITYRAGGYGYVGINPRFVPDMEVRQVIMHSFDTSSIIDFYTADLVDIINRPMSLTPWAYPRNSTRYYSNINSDTGAVYSAKELRDMITSKNKWRYDEGRKRLVSTADGSVLKLTFTIAGESNDHPAYTMFQDAEILLEQVGMEIAVVNSVTALQDLATGNLQVWAAAWASSIDPDPYQIYSKNSNASSTKNWNKDGIVKNESGRFSEELAIVNKLSDKIDEGRATLDEDTRKEIYSDCLDLIMQLAVEFPTYQRNNLCVYNSRVLDINSMYTNDYNKGKGKGLGEASFYMGPIDELWKVNYVK